MGKRTDKAGGQQRTISGTEKSTKILTHISNPRPFVCMHRNNCDFDVGRKRDDLGPAPFMEKKAIDSKFVCLSALKSLPPCPIRIASEVKPVKTNGLIDSILKSQSEMMRSRSKNSKIVNGKLVCEDTGPVKKKIKKIDPFAILFNL